MSKICFECHNVIAILYNITYCNVNALHNMTRLNNTTHLVHIDRSEMCFTAGIQILDKCVAISAARFGDLEPGQFFEPFGAQYFDLVILKFGFFLGSFLKLSKKPV